jgi:hypothetical protein
MKKKNRVEEKISLLRCKKHVNTSPSRGGERIRGSSRPKFESLNSSEIGAVKKKKKNVICPGPKLKRRENASALLTYRSNICLKEEKS